MEGWEQIEESTTQVMKKSLDIVQIGQLSPDPCHMITSVRTDTEN